MPSAPEHHEPVHRVPALRAVAGGVLMGLANLVPGISGGTMLLAAGVYPAFVDGVAEVSTFRFRVRSIVTLGLIVAGAVVAIVAFAGPVSMLVVHYRWVMYSLFIGLTLGGVPILRRMLGSFDGRVIVAVVVGVGVMAAMALVGPSGSSASSEGSHPYVMYLLAGIAGASAMVLPGVSGGYLLLVLGQYVAILTAIATMKHGVQDGDWSAVGHAMHTVIPVGVGVVIGVVGVSNVVKLALARYERATLGLLLGLLLGAVLGLWPFQQGVAPEVGSMFRGDRVATDAGVLVMERTGRPIEAEDYDTAFFRPAVWQIAAAAGLIAAGIGASLAVSRIGGRTSGEDGAR